MGGVGTGDNLASKSVEEENEYRSIVIPLGLFQVFKDMDIFDPDSEKFDIVRSIEYAASPLHWTHERDGNSASALFVNNLRNGELNRNLNAYRGFVPVTQPVSYGLANPSWGGTIPVYRSDRTRHGVFIGAGPYFAMRGALDVSDGLVSILDSDTDVAVPAFTTFPVTSNVRGEVALAITGGYRGRFGLPMGAGSGNDREGIYVALNYSYLRGFRLEDTDIDLRFDTDGAGLVTLTPSSNPLSLTRRSADEGLGRAIDFGVAAVVSNLEVGFGVNGIANEIKWEDVTARTYSLDSLFEGGDFDESLEVPLGDMTIKQPVEYTANAAYRTGPWTGLAQYSYRTSDFPADEGRLNTTSLRLGAEYRFLLLEPRGGLFYTREQWKPTAGVGINLGGFGIDSAVYWSDSNVQRKKKATFALSLRIGSKRP